MPIIARDNQTQFAPAPEGLHQAVCVDVVDKGLVDGPWGPKPTIQIRWQLECVNEDTAKRHMAVMNFNLTLNEKANLRKILKAWRGRDFTKDELEGFDLENLIGANCQVQIIHKLSDNGNTYGNVQAVVPLGKGMIKMQPEDYVRAKDRTTASNGHGSSTAEPGPDDDVPF